jgi:hypothetical protein
MAPDPYAPVPVPAAPQPAASGQRAPGGYSSYPVPAAVRTNPLAIGGLVGAFLFWPVGLALSIVALKQVKTTHEQGRGLALAGIIVSAVTGALGLLLLALIVGPVVSSVSTDLSRGRGPHTSVYEPDFQEVDMLLSEVSAAGETYKEVHGAYPSDLSQMAGLPTTAATMAVYVLADGDWCIEGSTDDGASYRTYLASTQRISTGYCLP